MGIFDWFSSGSKPKEEATDSIVRYLCSLEKDYKDMDDFLEDFYEVVNETIEKYNKNNPVRADKLDRDQAYKAGGRWIYEANIGGRLLVQKINVQGNCSRTTGLRNRAQRDRESDNPVPGRDGKGSGQEKPPARGSNDSEARTG